MRTIDASSKRPRPLKGSCTKDGIVAVAEFVEKSGAFMKTANRRETKLPTFDVDD
jgi:hypothetical protein